MSLSAPQFETIAGNLAFPEAPRWHDGRLWFSDFYTELVQTVDTGGHVRPVVSVPGRPSGLGFTPAGELLVVSMLERRVLRLTATGLQPYADLAPIAGGPCNDMVVDARGRAWVGNFGYDRHGGAPLRPAALAHVDITGRATVAAEDLVFPNGMIVTPDQRTLVVAESFANRLTAFTIAEDGALQDRRLFARFDDAEPDGIALDREGAVWLADPGRRRLLRVRDGGTITHAFSTGEREPYACALGGTDGRSLFVCTTIGFGPAAMTQRNGRIERITVEVPAA